jgi:hypothetical protein
MVVVTQETTMALASIEDLTIHRDFRGEVLIRASSTCYHYA